ncbi:carboxypeptidase-like regulatory domain-containing protein [Fodinibius salsisoli]|uniref:Carboxypeptidase regulatory-like domain-containing protein n=1 Tax=Fodinibius salsisoli TaxID=2820877 RepID=A0ABT3PP59_9BACT|nr:carboxypeptidase-like regulatory domain-containing protein [Fodinibius salsisoli]MCW9707648.1 carboxypeptidase regulatory-like domain-containing protein [Fodinibius salsisoli]
MKLLSRLGFLLRLLCIFAVASIVLVQCTSETRLLNKIPINSVDVEVFDQNDNPISGAQIEASNGRQTTTDADGKANIRFGGVGIYTITVLADNRMPNNFVVTMPTDRGETITARLTDSIEFTGIAFGSANLYPLIFNYMFSSYGYGLELTDYQEGQWTSWAINTDDSDNDMIMSKAFLKELDNGQQWWQVELKDANEEGSTYTAEVLFSEDRSSIVRYREQIGENEVQEKPVSEGWYTAPTQLTEESREGALSQEGVEITIPKGTYKANVLEYGVAPEVSLKIWQAQDTTVPGGVLTYKTSSENGELMYESELQDFGSDATTKLDSYE